MTPWKSGKRENKMGSEQDVFYPKMPYSIFSIDGTNNTKHLLCFISKIKWASEQMSNWVRKCIRSFSVLFQIYYSFSFWKIALILLD